MTTLTRLLAAPAFTALIASFPTTSASSATPRSVHGVVYEDANGNGRRDAGERGIADVVVSNQNEVVRTDASGGFVLPGDASTIVFVSVPTDREVVGPFWQAAGASGSLSFGLRGSAQPRTFQFIHASDTHISEASVDRTRRFRTLADSIGPAFTLLTGDLIRDAMSAQEPGARAEFELFRKEARQLQSPLWTVPGNHDHFGVIRSRSHVSETHPLYNRGMYHHYLGPDYYSFNRGGVHFIALNTVQADDSAYYGGVDSLQLEWVARDVAMLPADAPIVTFSHIPLASGFNALIGYFDMALVSSLAQTPWGTAYRHTVANTLQVLDTFRGHHLVLVLGGHQHAAEKLVFQTTDGPLRFEGSSAIVGPNELGPTTVPSGFTLYTVRDGVIDAGTFVPLDPPARSERR